MPDNPRSTASLAGRPLRPLLASFPTVCFTGALVNDIVYADTADMQWANFATWLLAAGLVIGGLAIVAELVDFLGDARVRRIPAATLHGIGAVAVMVVALVNVLVHSRDAWTSVMPTGLILSAVTVLLMTATGWLGAALVYRHRIGVAG